MKKLFLVIAIFALTTIFLSSCDDDFKDIYIVDEHINQSHEPAPDSAHIPSKENPQNDFISEEKAQSIALERAGVSESEVIFDRTELEMDNGIWQYEIEFKKGRTEYDADIKADDGTILSFDVDYND